MVHVSRLYLFYEGVQLLCILFFLELALNLFARIHVEILNNSIWAFWIRSSTLVDVTVI